MLTQVIKANKLTINTKAQNPGLLNQARIEEIFQCLFDSRYFAYFLVDRNWRIQDTSNNLHELGLQSLAVGVDATEEFDFLAGLDIKENYELAMITSPSGDPIRVIFIPKDSMIFVFIMDAKQEFIRQKSLQQKVNENQLLFETQAKLFAELETAKQLLESQNTQLQEAARLQSRLLSGVSHEFRTPLTSIIGYTNLLLSEDWSKINNDAENYLIGIKRSSKHLLSLIENLIDHGRFDSGGIVLNPKAVELAEIFDDVALLAKPLAITKNITFEVQLDLNETQSVIVDDSRLRQCLINIISNAIKFTDFGGVKITAGWRNDILRIGVADTGIGISEEHLKEIKKPFWQAPGTGKNGTGLGLTITERIIELMGGSLLIDSIEGKGTTVIFDVFAPPMVEFEGLEQQSFNDFDTPLNLLLVEDDSDIAFLVTAMLEDDGVDVTHLSNGALAVECLQHQEFDMVLMDLHMPILDGYGAIEKIRNSGDQTPIVIMTASAIESDRDRAEALGCDGYLVKPIDISDLYSLAQQLGLDAT